MLTDFSLLVAPRDATFKPSLADVARLIEYLDLNFYLEGPDRDLSNLVILPQKETKHWAELALQREPTPLAVGSSIEAENPAALTLPIRKRYVHLLHSPTAIDETYKSYSQLCNLIENLQPRDTPFVASLGRGAREAWKTFYCPLPGEDRNRWILMQTLTIVSGYHPVWRRIWDEQTMHKEWELVTVKAFKLMIGCKLNNRAATMDIDQFVNSLRALPENQQFLSKIGTIIGNFDLEVLGFDLR